MTAIEQGCGVPHIPNAWCKGADVTTIEQCEHETVDNHIWCPPFRRRFKSYRELCLDCGARRCRDFKRFRWGGWSPWA